MAQANAVPQVGPGFAGMAKLPVRALGDAAVPIAVLAVVMALIMPVPPFLLDFLIVTNIMMSVIVMMVAMYVTRPVEFSVFPTTLLLLTLFRLALNVSSSRLILLKGNEGTQAAGHVIEGFGLFVVGGNYVIGTVIFLVLIAIQYVVINHGAVRISEVTARFTLDAMPGKQMSIDAEMNAGLIDEVEARKRRKDLALEAEFYGAMDGASRFTQRDAVASILITVINIAAGFLIGVFEHGMDLRHAVQTYSILTIGDGLVTVIPALMISISGGLVVTRAGSDARLGADVQAQLFGNSSLLMVSGCVLSAMAAIPGMPTLPFLTFGGALCYASWRMQKAKAEAARAVASGEKRAKPASESDNLESLLKTEPLTIEMGLSLAPMTDGGANAPLMKRLASIRKQLAGELGYLLPPVSVADNVNLRPREYAVKLRGVEVGRFELLPGHELAIPVGPLDPSLEGKPTKEPAFGLEAFWIAKENIEKALHSGCTVVDDGGLIGTHLTELTRRHAHELFTRKDAKTYCDRVMRESPTVVEELTPKLLPLSTVQRVLQNLLRERVSIRDGVSILEAMGEAAAMTKNPILIGEYVRQSIRRSLAAPFISDRNELQAYFLDATVEARIDAAVDHGDGASSFGMAPEAIQAILEKFRKAFPAPQASAVVITSASSRFFLRQMVESIFPNLVFLSHNEVPSEVTVRSRGLIE